MTNKQFFVEKSVESEALNELTAIIVDASLKVHRALGPGLLESTYETCLAYELQQRGLTIEQQKHLPIIYGELKIENCYRLDIVVENKVIVEVKAVETLIPLHHAQLLTYLKLAACKVGLLINFNVKMLREGVKRIVNG
jgi:GxxExxY protein